MSHDDLGDRMKEAERIETGRRLDPTKPIYARIDGRGFSKFTKGMKRPFDPRMSRAMHETTARLVADTRARLGYTQSDEISLIWERPPGNEAGQVFFDGKVQKLCSVLAGMATAAFTLALVDHDDPSFARYAYRMPHFDARVFSLPSRDEGANAFLWRELDATRNAVSMAAQHHFSHSQLHGVSTRRMREMLAEIGVDFEAAYPPAFKRGTFVRRVTEERELTVFELAKIPAKHQPPEGTKFVRSAVRPIEMPPLLEVSNRVAVVFDGAEPEAHAQAA